MHCSKSPSGSEVCGDNVVFMQLLREAMTANEDGPPDRYMPPSHPSPATNLAVAPQYLWGEPHFSLHLPLLQPCQPPGGCIPLQGLCTCSFFCLDAPLHQEYGFFSPFGFRLKWHLSFSVPHLLHDLWPSCVLSGPMSSPSNAVSAPSHRTSSGKEGDGTISGVGKGQDLHNPYSLRNGGDMGH